MSELVSAVEGLTALPDALSPHAVTGVTLDSRAVRPGDLYAALPGANVHGATFAAQALDSGAVAILTDRAGADLIAVAGASCPVLLADDPRGLLGAVAAVIYDQPATRLVMLGITGTNGKTTTAYLLESALTQLGRTPGLIGTIETRIGTERVPSVRTTPEASDLHGLLALMAERGCDCCCMEVSSHALALHRVDGVGYDVAIFTNLSQDHLDFHSDMAEYFAAKAALFTPERARQAVVCIDDEWGRRLAATAAIPVATVANASAEVDADWTIEPPLDGAGGEPDDSGSSGGLRLRHRDGAQLWAAVALPGAHNVTNTALAAVTLLQLGYPPEQVAAAFDVPAHVPGRMQRVQLEQSADGLLPPQVFVDFAHTPEAVAATLSALRDQQRGRPGGPGRPAQPGPLVAVLGAGGDRDPGKRPHMGAAAARVADIVIVTDDNPRHEDPVAIRAALASGAREVAERGAVHDVPGRAEAIALALWLASGAADGSRAAGTVAVLGKGHETGQTIGDVTAPYDDASATRRGWEQLVPAHAAQEHS
nr:UDP-N-acetylmuramoyl-L-alanyl-D-glutamate--2,6-diaminopimelate ligase [Kineosphaera limosa]